MNNNTKTQQGNRGTWLPVEISSMRGLTLTEKVFLSEIAALEASQGCFASNAHFSEKYGMEKTHCSRIIKALEKKGIVAIELIRSGDGITIKSRTITLSKGVRPDWSYPYDQYNKGGMTNTTRGYDQYTKGKYKVKNKLQTTTKKKRRTKAVFDRDKLEIPEGINLEAWSTWVEHKESTIPIISNRAAQITLKKLAGCTLDDQQQMVNNAIEAGWRTIYELKKGQNNGTNQQGTQKRNVQQQAQDAFHAANRAVNARFDAEQREVVGSQPALAEDDGTLRGLGSLGLWGDDA